MEWSSILGNWFPVSTRLKRAKLVPQVCYLLTRLKHRSWERSVVLWAAQVCGLTYSVCGVPNSRRKDYWVGGNV